MKIKKSFAMAVIAAFLALTGCEKDELDRQMQALCEKDGGNKVYETVPLPAHMFDKYGDPIFDPKAQYVDGELGNEYLYKREEKVLKSGDPFQGNGRLTRGNIKIIRKSDGKVLGESIQYTRAGGDGFVIGHPTAASCPKVGGPIEKFIFVKE